MNNRLYSKDEIDARWAERLYNAATETQPCQAFTDRLEANLLGRWERAVQARQIKPGRTPIRLRWAAAAVGLLLVGAVVIGILGPQRVWADLLDLLGYVPGVGFIDLDETRVLVAPAEVTREGITLRVEQVLARADETIIVIESMGLPEMDLTREHAVQAQAGSTAELHLPDGSVLRPITVTLHPGRGTYKFSSLPQDVCRVILRLSRLPLVPAGWAPENWMVPLTLGPATGELVAAMFPQPYAPEGAFDTHGGVTLRVLAAAHSPQETALRLQLQWSNPDWETHFVHGDEPAELRDDLGHAVQEDTASRGGNTDRSIVVTVPEPAGPTPVLAVPTLEQTMVFPPLAPTAQQITLTLDGARLDMPVQGSFAIDLGDDPQIGDSWPLDIWLQVVNFPVHVTGARLVEDAWQRKVLAFGFDPVPDKEGFSLRGIDLQSAAAGFQSGSTGGYTYATHQIRAGLVVEEGATVPSGRVLVTVPQVTVLVRGPFVMIWDVPGVGEMGAAENR